MKNVRDLKITTKEGFSVKNLKRFPSMEYGEDGGVEADVYYKGDKILTVFDEGNGGCAITRKLEKFSLITGEINTKALEFLKRADKNWDKYDFLKNKTPKDIDDDDWLSLVNLIEARYDDYKSVEKSLKKGYKAVAILSSDLQKAYLCYRVSDVNIDEVRSYLINHNLIKKFPNIEIAKDLKALETI